MSTIGGLLMPQFQPYDMGRTLTQATNIQGGMTQNQTRLLELAALKEQQAAEAAMYARIQNDPALAQQLFGGSIIASLPTTGGPPAVPGAGALTQQPFGPGGVGPPQTVPGGQDLSQFALQGGPPQSTLASLGPQPPGGMPGPQNPMLEMARTNPRAAMMLHQQMQTQQDRQWKMQEQQLSMGVKVMEYIARGAQAVKSQDDLEALRQDVARVHPQAAASLPQMYSPEAMQPFITRGTAAADRAKNALDEAKARNLDMETRMFPELAKRFGMGDDVQAPAAVGTQPPIGGGATTTGTQARTTPPEFESAITEANRLYPQVSTTRIKSIIAAESNFDPKAVSSAGAKGPMQLMSGTAKDMGVDDPFDVTQNVRGGTRYYAQMLQRYGGDERKALAAYNWGPGNLDKVNGDVSKAPAETQAYVAKVLGGGGGAGTGTAQAPTADPRIAQLDAKIAQRTRDAQIASLMKNESLSTRLNDDANRLTAEKNRLIEESRHQQERGEEIPRAVQREREITQAKTDVERQRQAGPMLPEDRRKLLTGLRTDIRAEPTFKLYQDVRNGYQNVRIGAETDSGQGDLAIINGMAKILDPNSTVMSGEAKNVETAQGELERWFNSPQRFFTGDRLTPDNRQRFLRLAHAMATEKLTTARTELTTVYEPLAKEGNIDFKQLLPMEDLKPIGPGPNVSKFEKLVVP